MSNLTAEERACIAIPEDAVRACSRPGCVGAMVPDPDSLSADEGDGSAMVDTECDQECGMESCHYWTLSDNEYRLVFGHEFGEDPEDDEHTDVSEDEYEYYG